MHYEHSVLGFSCMIAHRFRCLVRTQFPRWQMLSSTRATCSVERYFSQTFVRIESFAASLGGFDERDLLVTNLRSWKVFQCNEKADQTPKAKCTIETNVRWGNNLTHQILLHLQFVHSYQYCCSGESGGNRRGTQQDCHLHRV